MDEYEKSVKLGQLRTMEDKAWGEYVAATGKLSSQATRADLFQNWNEIHAEFWKLRPHNNAPGLITD
jgi:glutamate synthase domain-containing protein 3